MAIQFVNVGSFPNDGTGDPLRTGFIKINSNFGEIQVSLADINTELSNKADLVGGKVPTSQLVSDVLVFPNNSSFPLPGKTDTLYVAADTFVGYLWNGGSYSNLHAEGTPIPVFTPTTDGLVPAPGTPIGRILSDNATWIPAPSGTTNLDYIAASDGGQVTSSTGDDADIPLVNGTNAGLLDPTNFIKLNNLGVFSPTLDGLVPKSVAIAGNLLSDDGSWVSPVEVASKGQTGFFTWKFDTNMSPGASAGFFRANATSGAATTQLYLSEITSTNQIDMALIFAKIIGPWTLYIQQRNNATKWVQFDIITPLVDNGNYWTIPVSHIQTGSGGAIADSQECFFVFINNNSGVGADHQSLTNLQGGNATERYHMTANQFANNKYVGRTPIDDEDYIAIPTDTYIAQVGTMSEPRLITLPLASSVVPGYLMIIGDESGTVNGVNYLGVLVSGSDTLIGNGSGLSTPNNRIALFSDGISTWHLDGNVNLLAYLSFASVDFIAATGTLTFYNINSEIVGEANLGAGFKKIARTTFNNADYPVVASDSYVAQIGTLSAARTVTLPFIGLIDADGYEITIADESGTASVTNPIIIQAAVATSNAINRLIGGTVRIDSPFGSRTFTVDKTLGNWTVDTEVVRLNSTQTLTNKGIAPRVYSVDFTTLPTSDGGLSRNLTPDMGSYDIFEITNITAILNIANTSSGIPKPNRKSILFILKDNGTSKGLSFSSNYASTYMATVPTATIANVEYRVGFRYNGGTTNMDCEIS